MSAKKLLWLLPLMTLAACGKAGMEGRSAASMDSSAHSAHTGAEKALANATPPPINSPERKMIRTADVQCRVQNVLNAVTQLEQKVLSVGGIIQDSHIANSAAETKTASYTADSLRQTQAYTTTAILTLRVPTQYLDSVVNAIPRLASFIDSRRISQNDVELQYLSNEWHQDVNKQRLKTAENNARSNADDDAAADTRNRQEEQNVNQKIEQLKLADNVNYATITVAFSQPEQVLTQIIPNPEFIARTPLWMQCRAALSRGWYILASLGIFLLNVWPLLIIAAITLALYRKMKRKQLVAARE